MTQSAAALTRSEATEARILDAAEGVFARNGLRGTRVRELALAAGVSAGTLYIYFPSKTHLYQAVLDRGLEPVAAILDEFGPDKPSPDVGRLIRRLLQHLAEHPSLSRLIYVEAISEGPFLSHLATTWFRPLLERLSELIREGRRQNAWPEDELPMLTASIVQVVFSHFALAPLLRESQGFDPLAPERLDEQTRFLMDYFERLFRTSHRRATPGGRS